MANSLEILPASVSVTTIPKAVADAELGLILAMTDLGAAKENVFRAFTEPKEIEFWWGAPGVYQMTNWIQDFQVGGYYSVDVQRPDGELFPASGNFLEINTNKKLVHTRKYEWEFPGLGRRETTISYSFEPLAAGGTRVTVRHEGFKGFAEAAYEHAAGWERVLRWLALYLDKT